MYKSKKRFILFALLMLLQVVVPVVAFATDMNGGNNSTTGNLGGSNTVTEEKSGKYAEFVGEGTYSSSLVTPEVITDFMATDSNKLTGTKKQQNMIKGIAKKHKVAEGGIESGIDGIGKVSEEGYKQIQTAIAASARKEASKRRVDEMGVNFNIAADTDQAAVALAGFLPLIKLLVGLVLNIIIVGATVFTSFDILYITMPVFREKSEGMAQSGNGIVSKQTSDGGTKFRWVTDEALHAVKVCNVENGKSPLWLYLRKRIFAYVAIGVVIYILFTGSIDLIVQLAINLVAGAMEALGNLGV